MKEKKENKMQLPGWRKSRLEIIEMLRRTWGNHIYPPRKRIVTIFTVNERGGREMYAFKMKFNNNNNNKFQRGDEIVILPC